MLRTNDLLSYDGANILARQITLKWQEQGFQVRTRIETMGGDKDRSVIYCVRSDMVNGWPRRRG